MLRLLMISHIRLLRTHDTLKIAFFEDHHDVKSRNFAASQLLVILHDFCTNKTPMSLISDKETSPYLQISAPGGRSASAPHGRGQALAPCGHGQLWVRCSLLLVVPVPALRLPMDAGMALWLLPVTGATLWILVLAGAALLAPSPMRMWVRQSDSL